MNKLRLFFVFFVVLVSVTGLFIWSGYAAPLGHQDVQFEGTKQAVAPPPFHSLPAANPNQYSPPPVNLPTQQSVVALDAEYEALETELVAAQRTNRGLKKELAAKIKANRALAASLKKEKNAHGATRGALRVRTNERDQARLDEGRAIRQRNAALADAREGWDWAHGFQAVALTAEADRDAWKDDARRWKAEAGRLLTQVTNLWAWIFDAEDRVSYFDGKASAFMYLFLLAAVTPIFLIGRWLWRLIFTPKPSLDEAGVEAGEAEANETDDAEGLGYKPGAAHA